MTTSASLNERLSENAGGLTKFVALHGTKIGMSIAMVSSIGVLAGAVAFAVTKDPNHLIEAVRIGVSAGGAGVIFAGSSKITNMLAKVSNPEWFNQESHQKDGVTTIESGPSASMEAKSLFSKFTDTAKSKFVEIVKGTPMEAVVPKEMLSAPSDPKMDKVSKNDFGM
jgi:hypothetical protein